MRILANGNVGINTIIPTALFHTDGTLRFENIPTVTTNSYVLTTDINGNVSRQLSSSFGGGGLANSCNTTNFITKKGASDLTCSQIFDNGTNVGINTTTPTAKFHNNGTVRLENIPNVSTNTYVLTSDINGNVTKQLSSTLGGVTSTCNTTNFIPKRGTTGLTCSQIFDNGTSVGIGTTTNFNYNTNGLATTTTGYTTGILKLNINGVTRGNVFISTSDESYKQEVNPIIDGLEKVLQLKGKTYKWNINDNPDMNFDEGDYSGFIAQEVEEVLPHTVLTIDDDKDGKGKKSVNYIEIIPYLVEAIKTQQEQIASLQQQLNTSFQKQNNDLINLKNTKIISVSPNPSSDVIAISLNIEETVQDAKLVVYDLKGSVLNSLSIKERGNDITRTIQKDNFGSGTYIVSLYVNGKSLDTKKIIFK